MRATLKLLVVPIAVLCGGHAAAQDYPSKPITVVVPYAPGGTNDIIARSVSAKMAQSLGQPVVVENKPGASGALGAGFVARAAADGYTILTAPSNVLVINNWVYKNLPYNTARDFAPLSVAGYVPNMLIVHPSVPASSVQELIAYAKANPGKLNFGSFGTGTTGHLSGELFKMMANVDMVHVPYQGSAPALRDLLGGQVQLMFDNMPTALPLARDGKVKPLAVTSKVRSPMAQEVPTLDESGLKGFDATPGFAFVAPKATPKAVQEKLNAEIVKALRDPEVNTQLTRLGVGIIANTTAEFAAFIESESDKWRKVVEKSGARVE